METREDFVFSVKGPKFITHMLRLKDAHVALANFFASGLLTLAGKVGPILWQLPPNLQFDEVALNAFLDLLPRDTKAVSTLAHADDDHVAARGASLTSAKRKDAPRSASPPYEANQFARLCPPQPVRRDAASASARNVIETRQAKRSNESPPVRPPAWLAPPGGHRT